MHITAADALQIAIYLKRMAHIALINNRQRIKFNAVAVQTLYGLFNFRMRRFSRARNAPFVMQGCITVNGNTDQN